MANNRKSETEYIQNIWLGILPSMIGELDRIALDNKISRNEVIRIFCNFGLKNKSKFKLR